MRNSKNQATTVNSAKTSRPKAQRRSATQAQADLVAAASKEFCEYGYDQTHSNKIAARAGFAPQTFYRHFENKQEIFLAVYEQWQQSEFAALGTNKTAEQIARTVVRHHMQFLRLRHSLRNLSLIDPQVRAARASARMNQISWIRAHYPAASTLPDAALASRLLCIERIADAIAEGELSDMGLSRRDAMTALTAIIALMTPAQAGKKTIRSKNSPPQKR